MSREPEEKAGSLRKLVASGPKEAWRFRPGITHYPENGAVGAHRPGSQMCKEGEGLPLPLTLTGLTGRTERSEFSKDSKKQQPRCCLPSLPTLPPKSYGHCTQITPENL